ncbi:MAG: response regulator [Thermodesulfobacteriota bacterium]|nr:response regulator [Thermodesulfobacteriota bacterium]
MHKVLIAEDDPILSKRLVTILGKHRDIFEVISTKDGEEAIDILKQMPVSLLITDIQMPKIDGLELLAYVNEHHPAIPCFVMTSYGTPEMRKKLSKDILRFFNKPVEIDELAQVIIRTLKRDIPLGSMHGIAVVSFLQMIAMEQKTCLFEVSVPEKEKGVLYFEKGILCDAVCGKLKGNEAAFAIITKERASFRFKYFPKKKIAKRITMNLADLIDEALRREEEPTETEWDEIFSAAIDETKPEEPPEKPPEDPPEDPIDI